MAWTIALVLPLSDAETAERLERAVDAKYLRREGGLIWLDVNREWRIGATAMRIISLAESRGSRFRNLSPCGVGESGSSCQVLN